MNSNPHRTGSVDTILPYKNNEIQNEWSVVWSTSHIPGMDTATGAGGALRYHLGRRRLRMGSLALACCLVVHCRISASALTGGLYLSVFLGILAAAGLGNPLRHFEVYLGQWSLSGPGRAFRIIPMLDGIGIAICINAIIRAICCCYMASMAILYVYHSIRDVDLPYTYCRDFDFNTYPPMKNVKHIVNTQKNRTLENNDTAFTSDLDMLSDNQHTGQNMTHGLSNDTSTTIVILSFCNESFPGRYPGLYKTPEYNFFFIEVMRLGPDSTTAVFNTTLFAINFGLWLIIWSLMVYERLHHGRLIWNNISSIVLIVPWLWVVLLATVAIYHIVTSPVPILRNTMSMGTQELITTAADALITTMYIHAASTGTELIHGKGLNHYAPGHIDPRLHKESVVHTLVIVVLSSLHCMGAAVCTVLENDNLNYVSDISESTLWVVPMYSKCALVSNYSHFLSTMLFSAMAFSYMAVAYLFIKSALHGIFEYRVKLVFVEQTIVGALICTCMLLSLLFSALGGLPLLESIDAVMTGISMPFICLMEMIALLYVYRSRDFVSDIVLSTEDNACPGRLSMQWQILPFIIILGLLTKIATLAGSELNPKFVYMGLLPLLAVVVAVPIRACHNAYVFLRPSPRRET